MNSLPPPSRDRLSHAKTSGVATGRDDDSGGSLNSISTDGASAAEQEPFPGWRFFGKVAVTVFACEVAVMFVLNAYFAHAPVWVEALLDATFLSALTSPFLWWWVVRPLRDAATRLQDANERLEGEIAEREKAEQARTQLLEKLVSAQEEERRRIARELHDQMGQELSAMMLELKACGDATQPAEVARSVAQLRTITAQMTQDLHSISWELRPAMLDDLGLNSALADYAEHWTERTGIVVDFLSKLDGDRLPWHIETTLYRVGQEALQNIFKHAAAKSVSMILERRRADVTLIVEDDGCGFDANAVQTSTGHGRLGLLGMRERVALSGGTLEIESSPAAGATIIARIPLAHPPVP